MVNLLTVGFLKGGNGATGEIGLSGTFLDFLPKVLWDLGDVWLLTGR